MERAEVFAACAAMRRETADWLDTLDEAQLATQSLCGDWRVRDVAGHVLGPLVTPMGRLLRGTLRRGLRPDKALSDIAVEIGSQPMGDLTAELRRLADTELLVPFVKEWGPFADLIVHNADMRVPLGEPWAPDVHLSAAALGFVARGVPGFTPKRRLAGLRVVATDTDHVSGDGAELRGASYDLLLALCGRRVGLDALEGPGRDVLAARLQA